MKFGRPKNGIHKHCKMTKIARQARALHSNTPLYHVPTDGKENIARCLKKRSRRQVKASIDSTPCQTNKNYATCLPPRRQTHAITWFGGSRRLGKRRLPLMTAAPSLESVGRIRLVAFLHNGGDTQLSTGSVQCSMEGSSRKGPCYWRGGKSLKTHTRWGTTQR